MPPSPAACLLIVLVLFMTGKHKLKGCKMVTVLGNHIYIVIKYKLAKRPEGRRSTVVFMYGSPVFDYVIWIYDYNMSRYGFNIDDTRDVHKWV